MEKRGSARDGSQQAKRRHWSIRKCDSTLWLADTPRSGLEELLFALRMEVEICCVIFRRTFWFQPLGLNAIRYSTMLSTMWVT